MKLEIDDFLNKVEDTEMEKRIKLLEYNFKKMQQFVKKQTAQVDT